MAELKTQQTDQSVEKFLDSIQDEKKRKDSYVIVDVMRAVCHAEPKMWGESIVGFGTYHYVYASGREADWMLTGFSPRKQALTLYITGGFDAYPGLLSRLGKYKMGKACLYVQKIEDIDLDVLRELLRQSVDAMRNKYPPA